MSFLLTVTVSCLEFCGYCWSLCGAWHAVVIEILLNLGAILTRICIGFVMMLETFIVFCICRIWHWHCGGVGVLTEKAWIESYLPLALKRICGICDWLLPLILLLLWLRLRFLSIFGVGVDYLRAQKVHLWTKENRFGTKRTTKYTKDAIVFVAFTGR
eukprot:468949_1